MLTVEGGLAGVDAAELWRVVGENSLKLVENGLKLFVRGILKKRSM